MKKKLKLTNLSQNEMAKLKGGAPSCEDRCACTSADCECKIRETMYSDYAIYDMSYLDAVKRQG